MSVKCHIAFYEPEEKDLNNFEALIYKHHDGEPENTLPLIEPILKDFDKNKGLDDIGYASAWLVAKLKHDYLNIGISKSFHGDIEYIYAVYPDRIEAYEVDIGKFSTKDIVPALKKIKIVKLN